MANINGTINATDKQRAQVLKVGDRVAVLNACRLPAIEEIRGYGIIESKTSGSYPLFFVRGFPLGRTAEVLRLEKRGQK